jgi:hypothetical protein
MVGSEPTCNRSTVHDIRHTGIEPHYIKFVEQRGEADCIKSVESENMALVGEREK